MSNQLFGENVSQPYLDDLKRPKDKTRLFRVIGAGASRTGTVSLTVALERLLNGPMCHGGSVSLAREEPWIKSWISICDPKPPNTSNAYIVHTLQTLLEGYVGVADVPCNQFVGELCEAFPNAVVIYTTRDQGNWWASMEPVLKEVTPWWLPLLFWSRSTLRYFGSWMKAMMVRSKVIYGSGFKMDRDFLETHTEYVKRVTPPRRLHFFDIKEGWAPLCKILNVPIPDEPFPHVNDREHVQKEIQSLIMQGVVGWAQLLGVLAAIAILMTWALK